LASKCYTVVHEKVPVCVFTHCYIHSETNRRGNWSETCHLLHSFNLSQELLGCIMNDLPLPPNQTVLSSVALSASSKDKLLSMFYIIQPRCSRFASCPFSRQSAFYHFIHLLHYVAKFECLTVNLYSIQNLVIRHY